MEGRIKQTADEISFKLLATKEHEDYDWLLMKINDVVLNATIKDLNND